MITLSNTLDKVVGNYENIPPNEDIFSMLEESGEFIGNKYYSLKSQHYDSMEEGYYLEDTPVSWKEEYQLFCESETPDEESFNETYSVVDIIKRKDKINNKRKKHNKNNRRNTWWDQHRQGDQYLENREYCHLRAQKVYDESEYYFNDNTSYIPYFIDQFGKYTYYGEYYFDGSDYNDHYEIYDYEEEDYNWYCREGGYDHLATDFDWRAEFYGADFEDGLHWSERETIEEGMSNFVLTKHQVHQLGYGVVDTNNINFEEVEKKAREFTEFFDQFD